MLRREAIANAEIFLAGVEFYTLAGLIVAGLFLVAGIGRILPNARDSWIFRLLILPGVVGLWPLVLWRWYGFVRAGDRQ